MDQYIFLGSFDLRTHTLCNIKMGGGAWSVKSAGVGSLAVANRRDSPKGSQISFSVIFANSEEASQFLAYIYQYSPDYVDFDEEDGADIDLYLRNGDWYYKIWGVSLEADDLNPVPLGYLQFAYTVVCYLYSPYSYYKTSALWAATNQALNETFTANNRLGHLPSTFERLKITTLYNAGLVSSLALNFGGDSLALADACLTNEIWELWGNDELLLETYEDAITSGTQWGHDWTGDGTFDTDHIELDDTEEAYILLSGPNRLKYPVKMTADISLDSGGATGEASVYISEDAITWYEVLTQDDFESGSAEYSLIGSDHMTDCYIKFVCNSGTSGKYLNIGSIKFECERWIAKGYPTVAAGDAATATLTGSGNVTIDGEFVPRRLFL
jgi:hypothetical protein